MKLQPHPRLYIGPQQWARLQEQPATPFLKTAQAWVATHAAIWARMPPLTFDPDTHNAFLVRAREVQKRVLTLLVRWQQTQHNRYRTAALDYIHMVGDWTCWSWISWRQGDLRPTAIFDLSYGENSATLAMAYDLLHPTLSPAERHVFFELASKWSIASGTEHCRPHAAWWFGKPDSNWNTVCAGGLGMLCLAMFDDLPAAKRLLPRVEQSLRPFMRHLETTSGAWPEGVGYWNYGMLYAFMYLLSWERSMGRQHPLMKGPAIPKTLAFPLDFTPNGIPCSFGDANEWSPLPFHYAVARRLRVRPVCQGIDALLRQNPHHTSSGPWASAAGWLLLHNDRPEPQPQPKPGGAKLYAGLDWATLADRHPEPRLFMSIRGGTTKVPHGHCDLFSFNILVKDEKLISNEGNTEYLDTTFSTRRYELPDINTQFKNTILINGVGIAYGATLASTRIFNRPDVSGVRLEGTAAMGLSRERTAAAKFCGRLALLLKRRAFLIIDRVLTAHPARVESRLHTHASVRRQARSACLKGEREALRLAFASNVPSVLVAATTAPTTPTTAPAQVLRWCTRALHTHMLLVTLAVPGSRSASVTVTPGDRRFTLTIKAPRLALQLEVSEALEVLRVR